MQRALFLVVGTLWLSGLGFTRLPSAQTPGGATQAATQPIASVEDIMISMIDPSADVLWNSVVTTASADGVDEKVPTTDEDWEAVRRGLVILSEGADLLKVEGRRIAAHDVSEYPGIELSPQQILALVDKDRPTWNAMADSLLLMGASALRAVEARDLQALIDAGDQLDGVCESCHMRFWYPNTSPR